MATRIREAIETRLLTAPQEYGEPLRRTLKGYWKLRIGDYRVVFRVQDANILILGIIHRKEVYQIIEKSFGSLALFSCRQGSRSQP